ncbi:unnamed protein product [Linum trigynum]|uniref:Uncharacterized protein n=1 Tax=Linum trigynum TaxID=586398 RepID=A0AAV2GHL2_9ROSI
MEVAGGRSSMVVTESTTGQMEDDSDGGGDSASERGDGFQGSALFSIRRDKRRQWVPRLELDLVGRDQISGESRSLTNQLHLESELGGVSNKAAFQIKLRFESTASRIRARSGFRKRWRSECDLVGRSSEGITMAGMAVAPTAVAGARWVVDYRDSSERKKSLD